MEDAFEEAIAGLRMGLQADGFELTLESVQPREVRVGLTALPGACLDCLVPDEVLSAILTDALRREGGGADINVVLNKHGFDDVSHS